MDYMSTVVCGRQDCSYHSSSGFCLRETVQLNQMGVCLQFFWGNGNQRQVQEDKTRPMQTIGQWQRERELRYEAAEKLAEEQKAVETPKEAEKSDGVKTEADPQEADKQDPPLFTFTNVGENEPKNQKVIEPIKKLPRQKKEGGFINFFFGKCFDVSRYKEKK